MDEHFNNFPLVELFQNFKIWLSIDSDLISIVVNVSKLKIGRHSFEDSRAVFFYGR